MLIMISWIYPAGRRLSATALVRTEARVRLRRRQAGLLIGPQAVREQRGREILFSSVREYDML